MLPPYVIYKAENMWDLWTQGGPLNTRYNCTKSGLFFFLTFTDWLCSCFVPETRSLRGKIIVIGDNLASHFSEVVIRTADENNIGLLFVCLPKFYTSLPALDVAFYAPSPLKRKWRETLKAENEFGQDMFSRNERSISGPYETTLHRIVWR